MYTLLSVAVAVIAGVLFYRLVERRHKVLLLRITLGAIALGAAGMVALAGSRQYRAADRERTLAAVTIAYRPADSVAATIAARDTTHNRLDAFLAAANRLGDSTVTFEICNRHIRPLAWVQFTAQTYDEGRSTSHSVQPRSLTALSGEVRRVPYAFTSDVIIPAGACNTLIWHGGPFDLRDFTVAMADSVVFR